MRMLRNRLDLLDVLPRDAVICEVGVQLGDFAEAMLQRCRPRLLVLVDSWQHVRNGPYALDKSNVDQATHEQHYRHVVSRFGAAAAEGRVLILRGRSEVVLPQLPGGLFDWLYLDADHTFAAISRDLAEAARLVRPGGLICGHDYLDRAAEGIDVKLAVDRFCVSRGWRLNMRTVNDDICSGYDSYALAEGPALPAGES